MTSSVKLVATLGREQKRWKIKPSIEINLAIDEHGKSAEPCRRSREAMTDKQKGTLIKYLIFYQ